MSYRFIHKGIEYEIDRNSENETDQELIRLNEARMDYKRIVLVPKVILITSLSAVVLLFIYVCIQALMHPAGWVISLPPIFALRVLIVLAGPWLSGIVIGVILGIILWIIIPGLFLYIFTAEVKKIEDLIDLELSNIDKE